MDALILIPSAHSMATCGQLGYATASDETSQTSAYKKVHPRSGTCAICGWDQTPIKVVPIVPKHEKRDVAVRGILEPINPALEKSGGAFPITGIDQDCIDFLNDQHERCNECKEESSAVYEEITAYAENAACAVTTAY